MFRKWNWKGQRAKSKEQRADMASALQHEGIYLFIASFLNLGHRATYPLDLSTWYMGSNVCLGRGSPVACVLVVWVQTDGGLICTFPGLCSIFLAALTAMGK